MSQPLEEKIHLLPARPGIYQFIDSDGEILYVGKAINLRSRVRSYFSDQHADRPHIIPMIEMISDLKFIETSNEIEALVLEAALIKKYLPRFNIMLKDDKSYAWIWITTHEEVPKVKVVRTLKSSDYKKGRLFGPYPSSRATRQIFKYIRKMHPFCTCNDPKEPCLYYHMHMCNNPTFGEYTKDEYMEGINQIIKFLQGRKKSHINEMRRDMEQLSKAQKYEQAALLRDKIADLEHLGEDIPYYEDEQDFRKRRTVQLKAALQKIADDLHIPYPERIECYDISNIQGAEAYGSMTVAIHGELNRAHYRTFKIKSIDTPNDYEMLREVLRRRFAHIEAGTDQSLGQAPDMILIDGGKGQLSSVADLIPQNISLIGISKGRHLKRKGARKKDQFWKFEHGEVVEYRVKEPKILVNLRDEAHRFALKHHRGARLKNRKKSILDGVKGIGPRRKKELIQRFGSIKDMRTKSLDELNEVLKNRKVAVVLKNELEKIPLK